MDQNQKTALESLFAVLGCCPEETTEAQLRARYLELVRESHPDRSRSPSSVERFNEVVTAFRALTAHADNGVDLRTVTQAQKDEIDEQHARSEMLRATMECLEEERDGGSVTVTMPIPMPMSMRMPAGPMDVADTPVATRPSMAHSGMSQPQPPQQGSMSISFGCGSGPGGPQRPADDVVVPVYVSLEEVSSGGSRTMRYVRLRICPQCSGNKFSPAVFCPTCLDHQNQGVSSGFGLKNVLRLRPEPDICSSCDGDGGVLEVLCACGECRGTGYWQESKSHTAIIPIGLPDNLKFCVAGGGNERVGAPGHFGRLVVSYSVKDHSKFLRRNNDLLLRNYLPIRFSIAALGGEVPVVGLGDVVHTLKVPAGTQCGDRLTIPGCGLRQLDPKACKCDGSVAGKPNPTSATTTTTTAVTITITTAAAAAQGGGGAGGAEAKRATPPPPVGALHVKVAVETPTLLSDQMQGLITAMDQLMTEAQYPAVARGEFRCWDRPIAVAAGSGGAPCDCQGDSDGGGAGSGGEGGSHVDATTPMAMDTDGDCVGERKKRKSTFKA